MAFNSSMQDTPMVEMNIIPLADVLLVLLIVFMVTTPTPSHSLELDLPGVGNASGVVKALEVITLGIASSGEISWNGIPTSIPGVRALMKQRVHASGSREVALRIDVADDADYTHLARVLGEAKASGMTKIAFVSRR